MLTPGQFAKQTGLELSTVQRWIESGRLCASNGLLLSAGNATIDPMKFARRYPLRRATTRNGNGKPR